MIQDLQSRKAPGQPRAAASAFCRACGQTTQLSQPVCGHCGDVLAPLPIRPSSSSQGLGVRTSGTRKVQAGTFPVIGDDGKKWSILLLDGSQSEVKHKHAELLPTLNGLDLVGRWLRWCDHATSSEGLREFWNRAARAAESTWDRRRLARWGLEKPRAGFLDELNLSPTEKTWLRAHAAMRLGRTSDALDLVRHLPPGTYPDVIELVACAVASGTPISAIEPLRHHLSSIDATHPVVLLAANSPLPQWAVSSETGSPALAHVQHAASYANGEASRPPGSGPLAALSEVERALTEDLALPAATPSPSSATLDLAVLWDRRAQPGEYEPSASPIALSGAWAPYVDDLLETWEACPTRTREWLAQVINASTGKSWEPVRLRLHVLTGEGAPGTPCEEARRAYLAADWSSLRALGDAGAYFLALADLRDGDIAAIDRVTSGSCLRSEHAPVLRALSEIASKTRTDLGDLTVDESLWTALAAIDLEEDAIATAPIRFQEWYHLTKSKQALYDGSLDDAASIARECLRVSTLEDIRDEALNLLAIALYEQGHHEPAVAALEKALDEAYSDRLLVNWALIKASADAEDVGPIWRQAALRAEYPPLRLAAGLLALAEADEDDDYVALLPIAREAVATPGNYDAAMAFLRVVGDHDEGWFKEQDWSTNPYHSLGAFRVRVATYHPDEDHLEVLGELLRKDPQDPELLAIRDSVVNAVMRVMGGDRDDDNNLGVAAWGLRMLDVVPLKPRQEAILSLWSVQLALQHFGQDYEDDELPGEGLLKFISRAESLIRNESEAFEDGDRAFISEQSGLLRDEFARQNLAWHAHAHDRAVDTFNAFLGNLRSIGYGYRMDKPKVRATAQQFADSCQAHIADLTPLTELVADPDLREASRGLVTAWSELQTAALGLKRQI